jgi:hypothetical protein
MARAAVSIYKTTEELRAMIDSSYKALQESQLKGEKETVGVD